MVPRKSALRVKEREEDVRILNVSATGAALLARTVEILRHKDIVVMTYGTFRVRVSIARIVQTSDPTLTYYGVQLVNPDPALIDELMSHTEVAQRETLEDFWRRSN